MFVLVLGTSQLQTAQVTPACTQELAVSVLAKDGRSIGGVPARAFVATVDGKPLNVESAAPDDQPRRILLVVDNGSDVPAPARKIVAAALGYIVEHARPQDRFALLSARGPKIELPFGTDRAVISSTVAAFAGRQKGPAAHGVLDQVLEGLKWFDVPAVGDSVLVAAVKPDENRSASFGKVAAELARRQVRMSSLMLGYVLAGTIRGPMMDRMSGTVAPGSGGIDPNVENIVTVSFTSGGYDFTEPTNDELRGYDLTEQRLLWIEEMTWHMYWAMTSIYRVKVGIPRDVEGKQWTLGLDDSFKSHVAGAFLLYPWKLPKCDAAPTGEHP